MDRMVSEDRDARFVEKAQWRTDFMFHHFGLRSLASANGRARSLSESLDKLAHSKRKEKVSDESCNPEEQNRIDQCLR